MAVTTVLTGTAQNIGATLNSPNITVANTTGWVVGATIQGTGIPAGTKINSFVANTSAVLSANYTGVTGTVSVIVSSNTGTLTVTLSASGDTASPTNIISAGFGILRGSKTIDILGATKIILQIATGATWDDTEWVYELGSGSSLRWNDTYGCGTWISGYILNGSSYIKAKGHTVNYNNFDGSSGQGGRSIFFNTGIPTGFVAGTTQPTLKWNDVGWFLVGGSNAAAILSGNYINYDCGRVVFDYSGDGAGGNAGLIGSYGYIESLLLHRCIGGVGTGYDTTKVTTIGKFEYFSLPSIGIEVRMAFPNNVPFYGFAPLIYQVPATNTFMCMNTNSNEILVDYTFPTGLDVISNTKNFSNNTRTYRRTVSFTIKDSNNASLTNTTLYVKSGLVSLVNAVQAGDFNSPINVATVSFYKGYSSYVVANAFTDTKQQTAQIRKYGYIQQSTSYNIADASYSQPFFLNADASLSGISEATAAAITNVNIAWENKVITVTANGNYDQINARIAYELALTTGSNYSDPRTIAGSNLTLASGWSVIVMPSVTLSIGTNITYVYADTFNPLTLANAPYLFNGSGVLQSTGLLISTGVLNVQGTYTGSASVTAVYANLLGTSTVLQLNTPSAGYSLAVWKADGTTKYFNSGLASGTYYVYFTPAEAGTYYFAAENYGQKRQSETLVLNGGTVWYNATDQEDVGITEATKATVAAYTTLADTAQIYDATANFRLSETGIKLGQLVARDGTYLDFGNFNVKLKDDASAIVAVASGTITYKSIVINESTKYNAMKATPPKTITPTDTEIINVLIEDANGDSKLAILGGDNTGYELWKITTATATDDYATGTLLDTLATNTEVFRFIGISGFDIVGRDISSGVRRRSSMLKGSYTQAFYVGNQIQLSTDAPQLIENNLKLDELILKIDTQKVPLTFPQFIANK